MGKYRASLIHEWWSDWHYKNQKIKRTAWMTDIDSLCVNRPWVEIRKEGIVAILELKWKWAIDLEVDFLTRTERVLLNFFEIHEKPFYVIVIDPLGPTPIFYIYRPHIKMTTLAKLSEEQMVEWINKDYDAQFLEKVNKLEAFM